MNVGTNNFEHIRFDFYRDRQVGVRGLQGRQDHLPARNSRRASGRQATISRRSAKAGQEGGASGRAAAGGRRAGFSTCAAPKFDDPRIREAIGLAFDFEWTNRNIMYSALQADVLLLRELRLQGRRQAGTGGARAARAVARQGAGGSLRRAVPAAGFGRLRLGPQAAAARRRALRSRPAGSATALRCKLPDGTPFAFEFLDPRPPCSRIRSRSRNLRRLGIAATSRIVDAAQYNSRIEPISISTWSACALAARATPGDDLRVVYGSEAAEMPGCATTPASRIRSVDALIEKIARGEDARGTDHRLPRARPRAARRALLGADAGTDDKTLRRLLGPVLAGRPKHGPTCVRRTSARPETTLVVRRSDKAAKRRHASARRTMAAASSRRVRSRPPHARLYPPPHPADDPDLVRDHADHLRHRAVRAGRPGRAHDRATARQRRSATARISGGGGDFAGATPRSSPAATSPRYRGAQGLDPEFIAQLEKQFGFDKPAPERFGHDAVELCRASISARATSATSACCS